MRLWRGNFLPLPLRDESRPFVGQPLLLAVALLCIVQGCCETNHEDALSSVYSSLVTGNGGGGNGDDWGNGGVPSDAEYITAIIGESVVFNCHVEFPDGYPVPYIVQWDKKGVEIPIHIWYDGYPTHTGENYVGRVDRVNPNSSYGQASLNVTLIRESDRGWYNCRVFFLNRSPAPQSNKNISGSWYHLDVHAPPRFVHTSDDVVYTKIGKNIILHCRAEGTPAPEIVWYKDSDPVQPSVTISIVNEGTELRISQIKNEDIGDYTCIARNGEGKIHHIVKVLIAGSAVIIAPPQNMTKVEGEKVIFPCEWRALPTNASVVWLRDGIPVRQISSLESKIETPPGTEGSLIVNPVSADDSGFYECRVTNGIGGTQTATAYLNVEYPAQVTYTPTVQYLPHRLAGVVRCYIMANPPIQFVMWTRDKHLLEPYEEEGFAVMNNGSLLIDRVKETHQGQYTCTPYNVHGTKGSSLQMQVIVKEPPKFEVTPEPMYQSKLGASLEIPCSAIAPNGTNSPLITWLRKDGKSLPRDRVRVVEGSLMIENVHETDFGEYECVASNEVATLVFTTKIYVEGAPPQAPFNVTGIPGVFGVTLTWIPGFASDPSQQKHIVRYRQLGKNNWETVHVTPPGSTRIVIRNLTPGKTYQFQVIGSGPHGPGEPSETVNITTKGVDETILNVTVNADPTIPGSSPSTSAKTDTEILDYSVLAYPTDELGSTYIPILLRPQGPSPGTPWNVSVVDAPNIFSIIVTWMPPKDEDVAVAHYRVEYRSETEQFKALNKEPILPPHTSYTTRHIKADKKKYIFRVLACSVGGKCSESEEFPFTVPQRNTQKAIVAGVVGGILFFIVAIILSVCAVKICNRRKRRKQEKDFDSLAYNMVACRLTDARNGGQIPTQPQIPLSANATLKKSGVDRARVVISLVKRAYRWVGRGVGRCIILLLDLPLKPHAIILTTRNHRPPSISSITLSLADTAHPQGIRRRPSSPLTLPHGPPRDVVDETSSDDGGFLAPRPLRYFPRGRRRFNLVLPGSFVPSSSLIRPEHFIPRPFASSPVPHSQHARSRSTSSSFFSPDLNFNLSSVPRFPVLVQVHQPPYLWGTATTGRHYHPHPSVIDPTPPPWEAERIRDNLARDLDYLERQVPQFLKRSRDGLPDKSASGSSGRFQERSSSSGFQSASKNTTSTIPSGQNSAGEILLRPIALPEEPAPVHTLYSTYPMDSFRSSPPRTYENWPRRESTPPIYAMARSPSFDVEEVTTTVPASEPSPSNRTLLDMSVDDPYEFDPVIPDTSPEIVYPQQPNTSSTTSTTLRFKRTREKYENMEARVAAMKEEFFEYRRRQKKRMESAC